MPGMNSIAPRGRGFWQKVWTKCQNPHPRPPSPPPTSPGITLIGALFCWQVCCGVFLQVAPVLPSILRAPSLVEIHNLHQLQFTKDHTKSKEENQIVPTVWSNWILVNVPKIFVCVSGEALRLQHQLVFTLIRDWGLQKAEQSLVRNPPLFFRIHYSLPFSNNNIKNNTVEFRK